MEHSCIVNYTVSEQHFSQDGDTVTLESICRCSVCGQRFRMFETFKLDCIDYEPIEN